MNYKVGFGFDVHRLKEGEPLWLGGIQIPSEKGAIGHSDADVLIHSICDALLGAAGLRDIGFHFPDNDPSLKGIDSKVILEKTALMLSANGYQIGNIDATVSLQEPQISPYIDKVIAKLAEVMKIQIDNVNIKATTTEKLGYEGRKEGVSAYAVALIFKEG